MRFLSRVISNDPRSISCKNLALLSSRTGLEKPYTFGKERVEDALPMRTVPDCEKWRLGLLDNLIHLRGEKQNSLMETEHINSMIGSLCNT